MYPAQDRQTVVSLRKEKKSYSQIQKITGIPKGTLSEWLSAEDWSVKIKDELVEYHLKNYKLNVIRSNEVRTKEKELRDQKFLKDAKEEYCRFKMDPLFTYGLGLYWGEGDKKTRHKVAITNTDPNMLRIMAMFYRKYLNIPEDKLRIALFIYKDINLEVTLKFWSELLQVPINQFIKTQVLESRAKLTKTKSKYGICCLYFSNTERSIKILEWIRLLSLDLAGLA